eukprot:CCRYP_015162-RA/>CCRYP_015162-RA protein AED:0.70 eAED:0.70 QI:0/0/0/1/1/1/2/0/189
MLLIPGADAKYALEEEISHTQACVSAAVSSSRAPRPASCLTVTAIDLPTSTLSPLAPWNADPEVETALVSSQKRKGYVIGVSKPPTYDIAARFASIPKPAKKLKTQPQLWQAPVDPAVKTEMNVAIADFIHSRQYDFKTAEDPKFKRILQLAWRFPPTYQPPSAYQGNKYNGVADVFFMALAMYKRQVL